MIPRSVFLLDTQRDFPYSKGANKGASSEVFEGEGGMGRKEFERDDTSYEKFVTFAVCHTYDTQNRHHPHYKL